MKIIEIKREKQENGLWGMPLNCIVWNSSTLLSDKKNLLFSAIITAIDEKFNRKFEIINVTEYDFTLKILDFNDFFPYDSSKSFYFRFSNYEVIDNNLYEFIDKEEQLKFLRQQKIKCLNKLSFII